jgi:hypothetical protein
MRQEREWIERQNFWACSGGAFCGLSRDGADEKTPSYTFYSEAAMNEHSRREFLWRALPGAAVAGAGLTMLRPWVSFASGVQGPPPATAGRSYSAGKYALEIDGQFAGWIESVEGGGASRKAGAGETRGTGENIRLYCGTGMSRNFYEWIQASLEGRFSRKSGALIACDYNYKEKSRMVWNNAVITEVGFPACDASSRDAGMMSITFSPEAIREQTSPAGGSTYSAGRGAIQKRWLPSNFRLQIDGLEGACTRVNKIEAIVVGQGRSKGYEARGMAGGMQASNLVVTLPETDAAAFYKWQEGFVKGNPGRESGKNGTLTYLTPDLREAFFTLTFRGLGISRVLRGRIERGGENIPRATVEMIYQGLAFAHGPAAWG